MAKRKIAAREVISDLRSGMSNQELMVKYSLSCKALRYVFKRLVEDGFMTEMEFYERTDLTESSVFRAFSEKTQELLTCPRCGNPLPEEEAECEFCKNVT